MFGLFRAFGADSGPVRIPFSLEERSAICFTTVSDTRNRDASGTIVDHIKYPVVTHTLPPLTLKPDKLLRTGGTWILRQTANDLFDPAADATFE